MREQMNIDHPNFGVLTDDMLVEQDALPFDTLIHPLVDRRANPWLSCASEPDRHRTA